ncbi:MAG: tetratricopeptide repeat protein [Candidatus Acidiferrales bacterium]
MQSIFANLFRKQSPNERCQVQEQQQIAVTFKNGDLIGGEYEICKLIGLGGFGEVYLAYDRATESFCALKTIRPDRFSDDEFYDSFRREALLWVKLGQHPFILSARSVQNFSGRLFVVTDYVPPDAMGRTSLLDHLVHARERLALNLVLTWAIQFCFGMEHARGRGIACHRDIKPANILITRNGTLRITDFGLAVAADAAWKSMKNSSVTAKEGGSLGLSLVQADGRRICGTPGYIAPELFSGKEADTQSDIYSFGLVLWQMVAGSPFPPFHIAGENDIDKYLRRVYEEQIKGHVPTFEHSLDPIIERCLALEPSIRYRTFEELQGDIEPIFRQQTGRAFEVPRTEDLNKHSWNEKGNALLSLDRPKDALLCYDRALELDPSEPAFLGNKANALNVLDKPQDAIYYCDKALKIDPNYAPAWCKKGDALQSLGMRELIVSRWNNTQEDEPRDSVGWAKRGYAFLSLERLRDAAPCFEKALEIDPAYAPAWSAKATLLNAGGLPEDAISCCESALLIDPEWALAWNDKGAALAALGQTEEAQVCKTKALDINPLCLLGQTSKGSGLLGFGLIQAAVPDKLGHVLLGIENLVTALGCYDKALEFERGDLFTWISKGSALSELGLHKEAMICYENVLEIDPRYARGWCYKDDILRSLSQLDEAMKCYERALEINPRDAHAWGRKFSLFTELGQWQEAAACLEKQAKAEQMIDPQFAPFGDERQDPADPPKSNNV